MFGQTLFAHLATERFVTNTLLDENVWSFSQGLSVGKYGTRAKLGKIRNRYPARENT